MGYDCTLHVLDEKMIRERFVPRLLGRGCKSEPFDKRADAGELWNIIQCALAGKADDEGGTASPAETAGMVNLMALAYSSAELPYHYERGFCLSLWPDLPMGPVATIPKKFVGDPEALFAELVEACPELKGKFPKVILGNGCTGLYVPAERVPELLKWVERRVKRFPKPDQRLFRGLLLVLKEAAARNMAYWEGTEVPVAMATILPPEAERRAELEEWKGPQGAYLELVGRSGPLLILLDGTRFKDPRTLFVNLSNWPPRTETLNEYATCVARSRKGRWLRISRTKLEESYRITVGSQPGDEGSVLSCERINTLFAGFVGEHVVAVQSKQYAPGTDKVISPNLALIEEDGKLVPAHGIPEAYETIAHCVMRLNDGCDVFCWDGNGYELRAGRFEHTFSMNGAFVNHSHKSAPACGCDGFFFLDQGKLFSVQRGQRPVLHLPKLNTDIRYLSAGPDGAVVLKQGDNRRGDLGELYFPDEDAYIRLEPELFEDEDPREVLSLHWVAECGRLIAATGERLWAVPIRHVLSLPRYRASTGRRIRS